MAFASMAFLGLRLKAGDRRLSYSRRTEGRLAAASARARREVGRHPVWV